MGAGVHYQGLGKLIPPSVGPRQPLCGVESALHGLLNSVLLEVINSVCDFYQKFFFSDSESILQIEWNRLPARANLSIKKTSAFSDYMCGKKGSQPISGAVKA